MDKAFSSDAVLANRRLYGKPDSAGSDLVVQVALNYGTGSSSDLVVQVALNQRALAHGHY
jgi:hypothetical protein